MSKYAYLGGGILIGAIGGYIAAYKLEGAKFDQRIEAEIEALRKSHKDAVLDRDSILEAVSELSKHGDNEALEEHKSPREVEEARHEYSKMFRKTEAFDISEQSPEEKLQVLESQETLATEAFDEDHEREKAAPGEPYIISESAFMENHSEFQQNNLSYFAGDDTLVDERDEPIVDVIRYLGHDNLKFGHGSNDPNAVYILNPRLEVEYEIVRSPNKYSVEVLGMMPEGLAPRDLD